IITNLTYKQAYTQPDGYQPHHYGQDSVPAEFCGRVYFVDAAAKPDHACLIRQVSHGDAISWIVAIIVVVGNYRFPAQALGFAIGRVGRVLVGEVMVGGTAPICHLTASGDLALPVNSLGIKQLLYLPRITGCLNHHPSVEHQENTSG